MKKVLIVLLAVVVLGLFGYGNLFAEDWYVFNGTCEKMSEDFTLDMGILVCKDNGKPLNSPADVIRCFRENGMKYTIDGEKTVNGKSVQVSITNWGDYTAPEGREHTYYRFSRCQEVAKKWKKSKSDELERYK